MKLHSIFIATISILLFQACTDPETCSPGNTEDFVNLDQSWIRIESNNPSADGMVIKLVGTYGVVTDKAGSDFNIGDIKWKDILAIDKENFMYEELGSDNNYYESNMELHGDDTLRIMVGSSGAGNQQKWVRDGDYIPGQGGPINTEVLPDNIREDRTLQNGPAAIDYRIEGVIDITARLILEPGTVIEMAQNAGIGVYDNGSIKAVGTESAPIVIKGSTSSTGWWRGIHIESESADNILKNVRIEDAGSNYVYCCNDVATLFIKRGARVSLESVHLKNGEAIGLLVGGNVTFDNYKELRIETHKQYPAEINPQSLNSLDGEGSDYSGNTKDYVFLPAAPIQQTTTLKKLNVPYLVEGKVMDITKRLIVKAGVEIVFDLDSGLGVYDEGVLSVYGTSSEPVIMRGLSNQRGSWRGIHLETDDPDNSINHLNISNAGSNYVYCCNDKASILFKAGSALLANCNISDGAGHGVIARSGFSFSNYENNNITRHSQEPLNVSINRLSELDGLSSSYTGNSVNYVLISDKQTDGEITIRPLDIPYKIPSNRVIDVTEHLNILPGVDLAFSENAGLGIYDNGVLNAIGTAGNMIQFRGINSSKGYWRGIHTETNSSSNHISYAEIKHAGSNYVYCCNEVAALVVKAGIMAVDNSKIFENDGCGIYVYPTATLNESGNTITNNTDGDICN